MRTPIAVAAASLSVFVALAACSSSTERSGFEADAGSDTGPATLGPSLGDASITVAVSVSSTVFAPNGTLPMANALVYVTGAKPADIPEGVYCDQCVTLPDGTFAVSAADGTFTINTQLPTGKAYIVTQKGQFRRVRQFKVEDGGGDISLDPDDTTLPGKSNKPKGDDVPKMAILKDSTNFDAVDESLQKLGITDVTIMNDRSLLDNAAQLNQYQIVFIPCGSSDDPHMSSETSKANLQQFVQAGGKLYVTDWSYEFVRQPFMGWLDWAGESNTIGAAASLDEWDAPATASDQGLGDWLAATGDATFEVKGNWTTITSVNTQSGLDPDGNATDITPKVWVTASKPGESLQRPTTVSFENQCGRVLFSTYHTEAATGGGGGFGLLAQEKALLYVLLEVGVCVGPNGGVK